MIPMHNKLDLSIRPQQHEWTVFGSADNSTCKIINTAKDGFKVMNTFRGKKIISFRNVDYY